ncbi:hypothetical protein Tco_1402209 [Tanacetum coccineum]
MSPRKPPSADSVHVLLKQALHAQKEKNEDDAAKLKVLERRKKKTLEVLGEDDDEPKSGVLSLPFMVRGHKKKNEAADEEARLALQ